MSLRALIRRIDKLYSGASVRKRWLWKEYPDQKVVPVNVFILEDLPSEDGSYPCPAMVHAHKRCDFNNARLIVELVNAWPELRAALAEREPGEEG